MATRIRTMQRDEWSEVAALIHASTNKWYMDKYGFEIFQCSVEDVEALFCKVYEDLDPNSCLVADVDGVIAASCFYHPRETHDSLGIMNVHPDYFGQQLGKKLLQAIIEKSLDAGKQLRLISSTMNLDSFSLYNKNGFQALFPYQDMLVEVPADGIPVHANDQYARPATGSDLEAIVDLELSIHGLNKRKDYQYYLSDQDNIWELLVYDDGDIKGALVSVKHPASNIVGHGIMQDAEVAKALIYRSLNRYRGMTPLVIIPADNKELVQGMYAIKAKNCELHVIQAFNPPNTDRPNGVVIPTFMPENG